MKRYGQVIKIKKEKIEFYKELHANCWPDVLKKIRECNIRNFSLYLYDDYLFSYYEYIGDNYNEDIAKMAADERTQEWWKETDPCQLPLNPKVITRSDGEWWSLMDEIFHTD